MANNKKFKIITTIEDDVPSGDINWCTLSFLTPNKVETSKYLDVYGFKVHNGYNTIELANDDAKKIKEKNKNYDVYLSQLGKIYAWDDATKTESVEYNDDKLNNLEKTRRENIDKIKLMGEQFKNEYKTLHANVSVDRVEAQRKRLQQKLYDKGMITQKEFDLIQEENKPVNEIRDKAASLEKMQEEMEECYKTDYLDENDPVGLKFGCMTIFSPKHIKGLSTLCFKIRGLFQTPAELNKRVKKLQSLYPNDRIYNFEIGKWCVFSENDHLDPLVSLKQLNYAMKCYLDNLEHEKEEFEKRKDKLKEQTEQESQIQLDKNRKEKKKEKRAKREANKRRKAEIVDAPETNTSTTTTTTSTTEPVHVPTGIPEDDDAIQKILTYLDDPELRDKFVAEKSTLQTMETSV